MCQQKSSAGIASRRVQVKFPDGPFSRTRPHPPRSRRSPRLYWCFSLLWRKTPLPPRPPPRRYRSPRRTHHFLLSHRHLPCPQRRILTSPVAFSTSPQIPSPFPLPPLFP